MRTTTLLTLVLLTACRGGGDTNVTPTDSDGDGFSGAEDCNDEDPAISPGSPETCNGVDDDCDGTIDDAPVDAPTWYTDSDGDGFGNVTSPTSACDAPAGAVADSSDCNDGDNAIHPGAPEADCTDAVDYNCDGSVGFADADGDGHAACQDCDDSAAAINPDAVEGCDSVDNDCDGAIDEAGADGETTWYADDDGDGYGDAGQRLDACDQPSGYVNDDRDCNDTSDLALPGGTEVCDSLDNDCNGTIDQNATDESLWYADGDGDGHGDSDAVIAACSAPLGFVSSSDDCNDDDDSAYPGATEVCDDVDDDCDGIVDNGHDKTWYIDYDGDGFGRGDITVTDCERPNGFSATADDCDDLEVAINPDATEVCNGLDDDCDGSAGSDETDGDGDGYIPCDDDCDDGDATINPEASEVWYDDVDQDCDGASDFDQDGDGVDSAAHGGTDLNDLDASCSDDCADGTTQSTAADSCAELFADYPLSTSGSFSIDLDADGDTDNAVETWCDLHTDDGGWTLVSYGHSASTTTSTANANHRSLKCGGGSWNPENRAGAGAAISAVDLVKRSTEIAFSMNIDGAVANTGSIDDYQRGYKFTIPDPSTVHFNSHSYRGPNWGPEADNAGPCVGVTVTGIHGNSFSGTRYTLKHVLGTSWTDSYPTGYGAQSSSSCVNSNGGPMLTSFHTGHGNGGTYGTHIDECDVTHGSLNYNHRGHYTPDQVGLTGASAIWLR